MTGSARIPYQPALDGVRALAVAAVLLFHAGVPGFQGGYLGVSVFFTLSGYLITSLLVSEHAATGRIDLRAFYGRRLRRLLPASALTISVIVVLAATTDLFAGVAALRAQVLGAVFQVANWVLLAGDGSYQELLAESSGTPSPLEHFWSLAIEEQFYWVWPACMLFVLGRVGSHAGRVRAIAALTALFAIAAPVIAQVWGPDAAYWATPARLSEILVGALLAVVLSERAVPARAERGVSWLVPLALAGLAVATAWFPAAGGPAYEGALPLVAVVSGALLLGLQVDSPLRRLLATPPFVWLGAISYGVYLYHWPIYVLLDEERLGTGGAVLASVRIAVTLVVSVLSYRLLEQPIRRSRRLGFAPTALWSAGATAAIAIAAVVVLPSALGDYWRVSDDVAAAAAIEVVDEPLTPVVAPATTAVIGTATDTAATTSTNPANPTTPTTSALPATTTVLPATTTSTTSTLPELARPVRIVVTGDSTADALGTGIVSWAAANPGRAEAEVVAAPGCGFVMGGDRVIGDSIESTASCDGWVEAQLLPAIERTRPDVLVVMSTTWDVIGHRWDDGALLAPMDPEFRARLDAAYEQLVTDATAAGAGRVAFLRQPVPDVWWLDRVQEEDEPQRHAVMYEVFDGLAERFPVTVEVIPFAEWFGDEGYDRDRLVRPDGVHLDPASATDIVDRYLGEQIVRVALGMGPA